VGLDVGHAGAAATRRPREKRMHGMLSIEIIVMPEITDLESSVHLPTPPHNLRGAPKYRHRAGFPGMESPRLAGRLDNELGNSSVPAGMEAISD
jgi:hypothetical protein